MIRRLALTVLLELGLLMAWKALVDVCRAWLSWRSASEESAERCLHVIRVW